MTEANEKAQEVEKPQEPQEVEEPQEPQELEEPQDSGEPQKPKRKIPIKQLLLIGFSFIVGFVIVAVIAIQVWEYSNSLHFCANACHDVHPEEIPAYQDSYHSKVKCVECHMGRVGTLNNLVLKASHAKHLPAVIFNAYDRPLESESLRPPSESCELCHWAPAHQGDQVLEIRRFLPDEENSEKRDYLVLKIGGGEKDELTTGMGYGIHWHALNTVEFIATDEEDQEIPWVRAILPDGREVEYNDVTNPLTSEEIAEAEVHTMDCVDCHNRVGHPFNSPGETIHQGMAEGRLSTELPFIKKEMLALLQTSYASQEEALAAVEAWEAQYRATYPEAADQEAEIDQAAELASEFLTRLVFEEPGITWESFADHGEHKESAGCFRCHDGKHLSSEGESIRLHCNICHSIPVTVDPGASPPSVIAAALEEPPSHLEANFIADHRFQASSACEECHGEVVFGSDDSSFCADSSCHGRAWPSVDLNAAFPHPIELEGKHAEAWCHDCHEGVEKPVFQCANCHEPPEPHFGAVCEDCHTPAGFEGADWGDFQHPVSLEDAHSSLDCDDCHVEGQTLAGECSDCHEPPESHYGTNCQDCHTPTSFKDATLPAEMHPIELEGAHLSAACEGCHADDETPEFVCSNCHEPPENHLAGECDSCHTPVGFAESASFLVEVAPQIPHALEGRDDCLLCHDPAGDFEPAPSNHADYSSGQCILCHKAEQ